MELSLAFITGRKNCRLDWLVSSLKAQLKPDDNITLIITDFWCQIMDGWTASDVLERELFVEHCCQGFKFKHVAHKPNVWNGPHRLVPQDWWAAASARNTSLCVCETSHLVYVDDLAVLQPGFLDSVRESIAGGYVVFGAYKKVNKMVVKDGLIESSEPYSQDNRLSLVKHDVTICTGGWCYGCAVAGSVEQFLTVGGWPEYADGLKFEDCLMGVAMENAGIPLRYDRRMLVIESEELHHGGKIFIAKDKGVSPKDKSHSALSIARQSKYFPNYYEGGMRKLRQDVLGGMPFPVIQNPCHDWHDGQPLSEMT